MKLKALSLAAAMLLILGLSACSSSDDASDEEDTTTTEEESPDTTEDDSSDTTDEDTDDDTDAAEAALDKIESNFGLTKKDPSDSTDDTTDDTSDDTTVSDSGLTPEEEECLVAELTDNPDLLEVIDALDTASVEDQAAVLDVMFECIDPSVLGVAFAQGIAESSPSLTADDALCLGDAFANLPPEIIAELLLLNSDPTYEPSLDAQDAVLTLFTDCGVDPATL